MGKKKGDKPKLKVRWAEPDLEQDRQALLEFYTQYFETDGDVEVFEDAEGMRQIEGLTAKDLARVAELGRKLRQLKDKWK